ncbi:hypothetical protein VUR80DRAFT_1603 [Thermomyces stellatus]
MTSGDLGSAFPARFTFRSPCVDALLALLRTALAHSSNHILPLPHFPFPRLFFWGGPRRSPLRILPRGDERMRVPSVGPVPASAFTGARPVISADYMRTKSPNTSPSPRADDFVLYETVKVPRTAVLLLLQSIKVDAGTDLACWQVPSNRSIAALATAQVKQNHTNTAKAEIGELA